MATTTHSTHTTGTANTTKGTPSEIRSLVRKCTTDGCNQTEIAEALNKRGFTTTKGLPWNQTSVSLYMRGGNGGVKRTVRKAKRKTVRVRTTKTKAAHTGKRADLSRVFEDIATAKFRTPRTRSYLLDLVAREADGR